MYYIYFVGKKVVLVDVNILKKCFVMSYYVYFTESRDANYSVIGIKKAVLKFVIFQKEMSPKKFFLNINIKFLFYFLEPYLFRTDLF